MKRLETGIRALKAAGAELVVLQELHNSLYFCQMENVDYFDLAEPIPVPFSVSWPKNWDLSSSPRSLNGVLPVFTTTPQW